MFDSLRIRSFWALGLAALTGSAAAAQTVYVPVAHNFVDAYIIDWQGAGRAQLVAPAGERGGRYTRSGSQRVITLDAPFTTQYYDGALDSCGIEQPLLQQDTKQLAVATTGGSDLRGTSAVVTLGTITTLTGCDAGTVVTFGALTDAGQATQHLPMAARPALTDLVPGVAIAGPSEDPEWADDPFPAADVLTLQAGGLATFAATGHVVPATISADGWLVLGLAGFERAYTRVVVDRRTGAEFWVQAPWVAGAPAKVQSTLMVKPAAGAGFGTLRQAARVWESGLFADTDNPFFVELYTTGAGARVSKDLVAGTESRTPITWVFSGANIVQTRSFGNGDTGVRTWKPLANGGGRAHFVMEDEVYVPADGTPPSPFIKPRVNFYVDEGAATPPATRAR